MIKLVLEYGKLTVSNTKYCRIWPNRINVVRNHQNIFYSPGGLMLEDSNGKTAYKND